MLPPELSDPVIQGADPSTGLVAAELVEGEKDDRMALFFREDGKIVRRDELFTPFGLIENRELLKDFEGGAECRRLQGSAKLAWRAEFPTWHAFQKARAWLAKAGAVSPGAPAAPFLFLNDPVHQYLLRTGRTMFKGMVFGDLKRLQVDIECFTTPGFEFCNSAREEDRIIAIAMADSTGWTEILRGDELDEPALLKRFTARLRERDPDVIEGHNIFNFDLPYLAARARRHKVKFALGRDGSVPAVRPSRFSVGERTIAYTRFDIFGRHVIDTYFLAQAYDISRRTLESFGLKEVAVHFGLAAEGRTYIPGDEIAAEFRRDPAKVMRYVCDDAVETRALSDLLSPGVFVQSQCLPYGYQNVSVRGMATKIDALLLREYLRAGYSVPQPSAAREFEGGYTDIFATGVLHDVHHCDVRSLYPSLMLSQRLGPRADELGVFLRMLERLRAFRLAARRRMDETKGHERDYFDALQTTFKIFINSFYGYLGFEQGHFNDYGAAEQVTAAGRKLLSELIAWLRKRGGRPVEIDTDGIYYVPPEFPDKKARAKFESDLRATLPEGIEIEFDGVYRAMFSYRMKNYALLDDKGEIVIKGAALKSRGLELFQREFMRKIIQCLLEERAEDIQKLRDEYAAAIAGRKWPIKMLAKTETLQDAPATYAAKRGRGGRARNAAYELALKSGREYRAGDQVSYYVTGDRKSVPVHASAKLVADWDPAHRDENIPYYLAKLDALYRKFASPGGAGGGDEETPGQGHLPIGDD